MPAPVQLIRAVPLFSDLDEGRSAKLAEAFVERSFSAGDVVVGQSQRGYALYVIESGTVVVERSGEEVNHCGPGDAFGEFALFERDGRRSATVTAETDLRCWSLSSMDFRAFAHGDAEASWALLQAVVRRLAEA
jgi:CRP/FNR family transcriptional regulator, cyclic AMP receptor protein